MNTNTTASAWATETPAEAPSAAAVLVRAERCSSSSVTLRHPRRGPPLIWVGFSAYSIFALKPWVTEPLTSYGVPRNWWFWLGSAKAAGAVGLLAGLFAPVIGVAAAVALILYFIGALITVLRARSYSTVAAPLMYLAPVAAAFTLGLLA